MLKKLLLDPQFGTFNIRPELITLQAESAALTIVL